MGCEGRKLQEVVLGMAPKAASYGLWWWEVASLVTW